MFGSTGFTGFASWEMGVPCRLLLERRRWKHDSEVRMWLASTAGKPVEGNMKKPRSSSDLGSSRWILTDPQFRV